jgi:hypothetical protein
MASRQVALDKRRLEAVDQLWSAVTALGSAKMIVSLMSIVKFDTAAERAERDPRVRQAFDAMGGAFDLKKIELAGAAKARPFLPVTVWATYSALLAMIFHAVMRWQVIKSGLAAKDIINDEAIAKLIKAALPQYTDFIDKYGASGYYLLVEQLESKLLQDLQAMLAGAESDKASLDQAGEILRRSNDVLKRVTTPE